MINGEKEYRRDNKIIILETYDGLWRCSREMSWFEIIDGLRSYLTCWTWFIVFVMPFLFSRGTRLLLLVLMAIGGVYVSFVHPREMVVGRFVFRKHALFFADVLFHQLPLLLLVYWWDTEIVHRDYVMFFGIVLLYFYLNDPIVRYRLRPNDLMWIGFGVAITFAVLLTHCCPKRK